MSGDGAPRVERDGDVVRITMVRPAKRNALSREHLTQLLAAVTEAGLHRRGGHRARRPRGRCSAPGTTSPTSPGPADRGAQPARAVHRAHADRAGRAAGGDRPRACAGHRRRLPAGRLVRPRGRRGVGRVRRAGRQGRLVLPHPDGRDRAERRAQAGHGARAHRRRHRCRGPRWTGAWSTGSCRTTSSTRPSTSSWRGPPAAPGPARRGASRRCTPSSTAPSGTRTPTAVEVMAAASQLPGAREGMTSFLEKRPRSGPD